METNKKPYPGTQAILRAIALLEVFSDTEPEWNLVDLGRATQLNRTTTYRIVSALESAGLVVYNPANDAYRLGSEMIVLGARALRANPLRRVAHSELVNLARQTGEMASLEVLEGDKSLILDEVKGENQRRLNTSIGNLWPAHATSTGKVLLAHLSAAKRQALLAASLKRLTPQTVTDIAALNAMLERVSAQGYAIAVNELEVGLTEVAAPLYNHEGQAIAAISIGGPTIRLSESNLPVVVRLLRDAAAYVSTRLGYRPDL